MDWAGPRSANVAPFECRLVRHTAIAQIDEMWWDEREPDPALQLEDRCWRLVQLGLGVGQLAKRHRRAPWLKSDRRRIVVDFPIEKVVEIQARTVTHKQAA